MRIDIDHAIATGPVTIKLSHGNRSMIWDVGYYNKASDARAPMNTDTIFKAINEFWATLTQAEQAAYWDLYVEAREIFDNMFEVEDIQTRLQDIVRRMYELPTLEKLANWTIYRSDIRIPSDLRESFEETTGDMINYPHRREKTYLRGEYVDLAIMTIALRIMVPIWGEFIRSTKREVGSVTKELEAYRLLYSSRINTIPAMIRLQQYVHTTVMTLQGNEANSTAIMNGMGAVEFNDWMLARAIVRRLAICPISSEEGQSNIITNVYQFVRVAVNGGHKQHLKKFGGKLALRNPNEAGEDGQKKASADVYKIKQEVPDGIRVLMHVYFDDPLRVLYRALGLTKPGVAGFVEQPSAGLEDRLNTCLQWMDNVPDFEVLPHHLTLVQWTLSPLLSPRAIPLLTLDALKRALAIVQTILWEWDFYDLAALVTAKPYEVDDDTMLGASETRGRIPKELLDDLNQRWPYIQPARGKQSFRQSNVAAKAVDAICDHMTSSDWVLCCPSELVERVSRNGQNRRFSIPSDIRWTLSNLLIKIESLIAQEEIV